MTMLAAMSYSNNGLVAIKPMNKRPLGIAEEVSSLLLKGPEKISKGNRTK